MRVSLIKGSVADAVRLRRSSPVEIEDFSAGFHYLLLLTTYYYLGVGLGFRGNGLTLSPTLSPAPDLTLNPNFSAGFRGNGAGARLGHKQAGGTWDEPEPYP